jgi:hypothetical protein
MVEACFIHLDVTYCKEKREQLSQDNQVRTLTMNEASKLEASSLGDKQIKSTYRMYHNLPLKM